MKIVTFMALFLMASPSCGADFYFDSAPFTTYGEFNPTPLTTSTEGGHTVKQLNPGQSVRFSSTSTFISWTGFQSTAAGRTLVVEQDGVQVGSGTFPATGGGSYETITLATGLSGLHEYKITCVTPMQGAWGNWHDLKIGLDADSLAAVAHPVRFALGFYGDSITGLTNVDFTDVRSSDMWIACQENDHAMIICGVAGGKVVNTGRDNTANIPTNVDGVAVRYSINDAPDLPSGAAVFRAAYSQMIENIRTRIGAGKPIVCFRPLGTVTPSAQEALGVEIQAAISGKANVTYVDTDGWITEATTHMPDGLHPNAVGYAEIAAPLAEALSGAIGSTITTTNAIFGTLTTQ